MDISDFLLRANALSPEAKVMIAFEPNGNSISVEWRWEREGQTRHFRHRLLLKELLFDEAIEAFFSSCAVRMKNAVY